MEIEPYLKEKTIATRANPLEWWNKSTCYPNIPK
jgi:hypothetical protein